jgi:hypothetical protein
MVEGLTKNKENQIVEPPKLKKLKLNFMDFGFELEAEQSEDLIPHALGLFDHLLNARIIANDRLLAEPGEEDSGEVQDKTKPLQADIKFKQEGYV